MRICRCAGGRSSWGVLLIIHIVMRALLKLKVSFSDSLSSIKRSGFTTLGHDLESASLSWRSCSSIMIVSCNFYGAFEMACGALIFIGLVTRLASIPTLSIMFVAMATSGKWLFDNKLSNK